MTDAQLALTQFRQDLAQKYRLIEFTATLADSAMQLAEKHVLRGYDAVQLASAIALNMQLLTINLPAIIFVTADNALNSAAILEGLTVDNPNNYP